MNELFIYLITIADSIKWTCFTINIILVTGLCVILPFRIYYAWRIAAREWGEEDAKMALSLFDNIIKPAFIIFIILTILAIIIPTSHQLVMIYIIPKLLSVETVEKIETIPPKILELLDISMDQLKDYLLK